MNKNLLYRSLDSAEEERMKILEDDSQSEGKHVLNLITYSYLLRNEMSNDHVSEAITMLKSDKSLYKQEIKKQVSLCVECQKRYEGEGGILSTIGIKSGLLCILEEIYDAYKERLNNTTTKLYYAIKQELDNLKIPRSAMIAQMELTRIILESSLHRGAVDSHYNALLTPILKNLQYLIPSEMTKRWERLCTLVYNKASTSNVNLNTKRVTACFNAFANELSDYRIITDIIKEHHARNN